MSFKCSYIRPLYPYIRPPYIHDYIIYEHVYFAPVKAFYLWKSTRPTFAGRIILLGDNHDLGRGSSSWQKMMILAEDHDLGRQACSCWNSMILVENKEPPFGGHLGTIFSQVRKLISKRFWTGLGSKLDRRELAKSVKEGQKRHIHMFPLPKDWLFMIGALL